MRALIVSASSSRRHAWRDAARGAGLQVLEAECAAEALLALRVVGVPELALIDGSSPTSAELVAHIRSQPGYQPLRLLLVAQEAGSDSPDCAALPGVDGILPRRFTAETLDRKLDSIGLRRKESP